MKTSRRQRKWATRCGSGADPAGPDLKKQRDREAVAAARPIQAFLKQICPLDVTAKNPTRPPNPRAPERAPTISSASVGTRVPQPSPVGPSLKRRGGGPQFTEPPLTGDSDRLRTPLRSRRRSRPVRSADRSIGEAGREAKVGDLKPDRWRGRVPSVGGGEVEVLERSERWLEPEESEMGQTVPRTVEFGTTILDHQPPNKE